MQPGYVAFPATEPVRLAPELAKPLVRAGRLLPGYFVVQFRGPVVRADDEWLERATAPARARVGHAAARWDVPGDARGVWLDDLATWRALVRSPRVAWVGRHQPGYKLDPALLVAEHDALGGALELVLVPGHPRDDVARQLEELGARVLGHAAENGADVLHVEAPPGSLVPCAWIEGVHVLRSLADPDASSPRLRAAGDDARTAARARLGAPTTFVLRPTQGYNPRSGTLSSTDLARVQASDDERLALRDREQLTLGFDAAIPAGATLVEVRVLVEHHEEARVDAGEVLWSLGHGGLTDATLLATTTAPLRSGEDFERLDVWASSGLALDLATLKVVLANESNRDDTLLDRVAVEVDCILPVLAPRITSAPSTTGTVGLAYRYDADERAEADGEAPLTWSLVDGPAGFVLESASGRVSWTPAAAGTYPVVLRAANAHGSDTQAFEVVVTTPPFPATLVPANPTALVYCPPERLALGPAKSQQRLNVFLPPGAAPPEGWPVLLNNRAGGGFAATPLTSLSATGGTAALHALVASGVAVVDFGVTRIADGQGLFYPPGHASGRYESFRPADDCPEKEAEWAVQWLKTQASYPLDPERICLRGSSHGAIIAIWAAMGPERARASGSAHVRASTRVRGVLALQPPTSVWAFDQDPTLVVRMVAHFEQAALPGVPATHFGQVARELQEAGSVMGFAFDTAAARLHNEGQALCLLYAEPVTRIDGAPADMTLDARGFPKLHDVLGNPFVHDSWAGYVLYARLLGLSPRAATFHRLNSVFAVRDTTALAPPLDLHTHTFSGGITGTQATALAHEWVLATLRVTPHVPSDAGTFGRAR